MIKPGAVYYFDGISHVEVYCSKLHADLQLKNAQGINATWKDSELQTVRNSETEWMSHYDTDFKCGYCESSIIGHREALNYDDACKMASDEQGITSIVDALKAVGIEASVEQTGGFCMVAYVDGDIPENAPETHPLGRWSRPRIGLTWECIVLYADEEDQEGEMLFTNENDVTGEYLNNVVEVVKENLPRIKRSANGDGEFIAFVLTTLEEMAAILIIKDIVNFKMQVAAHMEPDSYAKFLMAIHVWLDDELEREVR